MMESLAVSQDSFDEFNNHHKCDIDLNPKNYGKGNGSKWQKTFFLFPKILTRDWITDGFREVLRTTGFEIPISFK